MLFSGIRYYFDRLEKRRNIKRLLLSSIGLVPVLGDFDVKAIVRNFSKSDSDITSKYSLSLGLVTKPPVLSLTGQDYCPFQEKICSVDAPHHIALVVDDLYEGHPYSAMIAVIGFEIRGKSIIVRQIQGGRIRPKVDDKNVEFKKHVGKIRKWILSRLNWEQFLVKTLEEWSLANGFANVKIQYFTDNAWRQQTKTILGLQDSIRNERLEKHYDTVAKILGYKRSMSYWNKPLSA